MPKIKHHDINRAVGKQIQKVRCLVGLTQGAFGDKLDVSYQQVQKYESGRGSLSVGMLIHVSAVLQCSILTLLDIDGAGDIPDRLAEVGPAMRLGRILLSIEDARVRRNVIRFVESLAPAAAPAEVAAPPALAAE